MKIRSRLFLIAFTFLLLIPLLAACASVATPAEQTAPLGGVTEEGFPYEGSLDAPVVIQDFGDFQ